MKFTKKQREEVVEVLRCGADVADWVVFGVDCIAAASRYGTAERQAAEDAYFYCLRQVRDEPRVEMVRGALLEAALLVEEGTLP